MAIIRISKILAIPVCFLVIVKITLALQNLNEALSRVDKLDQEQTVWASTQIDNSITDFRRLILYELYAPDKMMGKSIDLEFDIFYSRLVQVSDPILAQVLENTNFTLPVGEVERARASMANILDAPGPASGDNLFQVYTIASDLQDLWRPYKFAILQAAREQKFNQLEAARDALSNARNSILIGALFVLITLGLVFINVRISSRREVLEDELRHDALTGSLSRSGFYDVAAQEKNLLSIAVIDLNKLKEVNDTLGHSAGDQLLKAASVALENVTSQAGFVARVGGDEFWVGSSLPVDELAALFNDASKKIMLLFPDYKNISKQFPLSYGICLLTNFSSLDGALLAADQKMYQMKRKLHNEIAVYKKSS
ncbi:sensory box/GGDEF family protein [Roseobacter sp. AzwK-3b]|uniref:GGDEF domain-containing protein n=1 Tax=Roseobacter sp. AzwK-3b TaxID=351016 RepID=UPI00015691EA|nr:GGDEF domain-containing protein [Roseobacter sp. AzwK-3b]EDM72295.1 sensory box/GGDEF family protein [Roseobacter sp. AzwK-3b]